MPGTDPAPDDGGPAGPPGNHPAGGCGQRLHDDVRVNKPLGLSSRGAGFPRLWQEKNPKGRRLSF